jgi:hypothetical protein
MRLFLLCLAQVREKQAFIIIIIIIITTTVAGCGDVHINLHVEGSKGPRGRRRRTRAFTRRALFCTRVLRT